MLKKFLCTLLTGVLLLSSSTCFAANNKSNIYTDMSKANSTAAAIEKKGQTNTRYEYTGFEVADKAVKLGFKRYLLSNFKYYNGEPLELREIPNETFKKSIHLEVSCVDHDMTIYLCTPDNYIKGKFKKLCELVLPGYGNSLYNKVLSTKKYCKNQNIGGKIFNKGSQSFKMGGRVLLSIKKSQKRQSFLLTYKFHIM